MKPMKSGSWMASAALAGALLVTPLAATAQYEAGATGDSSVEVVPGKILDLAMCAVSVAAIETGFGAAAAVITCTRAAVMWWTE
jgi:hypothetical protein